MKQLVASILLTILVSACAKSAGAPAPTPEPTRLLMAPAPTAAPNPSQALATPTAVKPGAPAPSPTEKKGAAPLGTIPAGIAMLNITQEKMADGSIRTTASVAAPDNLGLGQVELAYPETMGMDESATVALKLSPAAQLVSLTPIAAPGKTPDVPAFVYRFSGNVQLYPMMYAELRAVSFDLDQS
jgi:hypothetical protein